MIQNQQNFELRKRHPLTGAVQSDLKIIEDMGVDTYHFSMTWSKLFPNGGADEQPDAEYESYLESLLDGLIDANIKAVVTIFRWGFYLM